jgi:hypothetical protein
VPIRKDAVVNGPVSAPVTGTSLPTAWNARFHRFEMLRQVAVLVWISRLQRSDLVRSGNGRRGEIGGFVFGIMNLCPHRLGLGVKVGEDADDIIAEPAISGDLRISDEPAVAAKFRDLDAQHSRRRVADDGNTRQAIHRLAAMVGGKPFNRCQAVAAHQAATPMSCLTSFTAAGAPAA